MYRSFQNREKRATVVDANDESREAILKRSTMRTSLIPFFPEIVSFMTSGPVLGMIVEGENAVRNELSWARLSSKKLQLETIRGDFAHSTSENDSWI